MSRCWAVTQTRVVMSPRAFRARTTGAILMASGRVPKTMRTFRGPPYRDEFYQIPGAGRKRSRRGARLDLPHGRTRFAMLRRTLLFSLGLMLLASPAPAIDCSRDSTGLVPLTDLGSG